LSPSAVEVLYLPAVCLEGEAMPWDPLFTVPGSPVLWWSWLLLVLLLLFFLSKCCSWSENEASSLLSPAMTPSTFLRNDVILFRTPRGLMFKVGLATKDDVDVDTPVDTVLTAIGGRSGRVVVVKDGVGVEVEVDAGDRRDPVAVSLR